MIHKNPDEHAAAEMTGALMLIAVIIAVIAIIAVVLFSQPLPDKIPAVTMTITNESKQIMISHNGGDTLLLTEMGIRVDNQPVSQNTWICEDCSDDFSLGDMILIDSPDLPNRVDIISKKAGNDNILLMTQYMGIMTFTQTPHTPPVTTIPPAPAAGFTANQTSGYSPLDIAFTDTSTNMPTSWIWDFGDGGTSIEQNPVYQYTTAGSYTVSLKATNAGGSSTVTRTDYIIVTSPSEPVTDIYLVASRPFYLVSGGAMEFKITGANSRIVHATITYNLAPGDTVQLVIGSDTTGSVYATSTTVNTFSFDDVRLFINGDDKGTGTVDTIWVSGYNEYASTLSLDLLPQNAWTRFDVNHSTLMSDVNNSRIQVFNLLPSEGVLNLDNTAALNTFYDGGAGGYLITPGPLVPVADFNATPLKGNRPLTVVFMDNSTNSPTSWTWDFGDLSLVNATRQNPVHTYANTGLYTVSLTATNGAGSNQVIKTNYINVTNIPVPIARFRGNPTTGTIPLNVEFTDQSTGSPTAWSWTFGDIGTGNTSTLRNPTHAYTVPGTYTVSLTVSNDGGSNTMTRSGYIQVNARRPVVSFTGTPRSGTRPLEVTFTDTSTNYPTSWSWDFGDGSTSTLQNPVHIYTRAGTYRVTLIATNSAGSDTESINNYITVTAPFAADFTYSKTWILFWCFVDFTDTSTGSPAPDSWYWDFGDGSTSTAQNPSHTYWFSDDYNVTLTISNSAGDTDTITINIGG
jgi:PKD repeat protein